MTADNAPADILEECPFHFVVAFWGEQYRWFLLNLCLRSLLSPRNIPALVNKRASRFVVFAPRADLDAVEKTPIVELLRQHIELQAIEIPAPTPGDDKFALMTRCHGMAAANAMEAKAFAVFLCPDAMLSDGTVVSLQERARRGAKVVLVAALRHSQDALLEDMRASGLLDPDEPLTLSSRELMRLGFRHMHPQVHVHDWDSPAFSTAPGFCIWRVPGREGWILHNTRWGPLLFSYRDIKNHDVRANYSGEGHISIDDDYVYRNFGLSNDIHVVTDSDEIAYVSLTPDTEAVGDATTSNTFSKRICLRVNAFSGIMDPLQWKLFRLHVRLHADDITDAWDKRVREIDHILDRCLSRPPNRFERLWQRFGASGLGALLRRIAARLMAPAQRFVLRKAGA
jgi:hypothetical protein